MKGSPRFGGGKAGGPVAEGKKGGGSKGVQPTPPLLLPWHGPEGAHGPAAVAEGNERGDSSSDASQRPSAGPPAVQAAVQQAAVQHEAEVGALQRRLEAQAVAHEAEVGLAVHAAVQVAVQAHEVEAGQARLTIAQLEERLAVDSQVRKNRAPEAGGKKHSCLLGCTYNICL